MGYTIALYSVFIWMAVLAVILLATFYLCELVNYFKNKRHKKWCAWVFERYPELKVLLSNYHRLQTESSDTSLTIHNLRKAIDEWIEENRYLPEGRKIDKHIEVLKEQYQKLLDIRDTQRALEDNAKRELENFWKTNFPDLREDKWIMWWSE